MPRTVTLRRYLAHRAPDVTGTYYHQSDIGSLWNPSGFSMPANVVTFRDFGGGDYVGDDLMAEANRHALRQDMRTPAGRDAITEWTERRDYGYQNVFFPLDQPMRAEVWGTVVKCVRDAAEYPVLDEGKLSELEMQNEERAWKDYGAWDLVRHIREHCPEPEATSCNDVERLRWELMDAALDEVQPDPYSVIGQRLWHAVHAAGTCERETPGSCVLYPEPFTGRHMQNYGERWTADRVAVILFTPGSWENVPDIELTCIPPRATESAE